MKCKIRTKGRPEKNENNIKQSGERKRKEKVERVIKGVKKRMKYKKTKE